MAENNIHADGQEILSSGIPIFLYVLSICIYIYMSRVFSRNGPMRVKWAPFCNFRGAFFKKGGPRKGIPQKVFELIGTDFTMRKRTLIYVLPPFWNILGN